MIARESDSRVQRALAALLDPPTRRPRTAGTLRRPQTSAGVRRVPATSAAPPPPPPPPKTSASQSLLSLTKSDPLLAILEQRSGKQHDALLFAAEAGRTAEVARLLSAGADPNRCHGLDAFTPLHHACSRGHLSTARQLLLHGCASDARTKVGETALHLAAYGGHRVVAELLLESGAAPDVPNDYGETALFHAARRGHVAVVRLLLRRGADPEHRDRFGDTARELAADKRTEAAFDQTMADAAPGGATQSPWYALEERLVLRVCRFLGAAELCRTSAVCSRWHRIADSSAAWRHVGQDKARGRWQAALGSALGVARGQLAVAPFLASLRVGEERPRPRRPASAQPATRRAQPPPPRAAEGALVQSNGSVVLGRRPCRRRPATSPTRAVVDSEEDEEDDAKIVRRARRAPRALGGSSSRR